MEQVRQDVREGIKSPTTINTYESILKRHVIPGTGELRVREATVMRLDRFLGALQRTVGTSTAKTARTALSGMLGLAARYDAIDSNPTRDTRRIPKSKKKPRALDAEERTKWLARVEANEKARRWDLPDLSRFMVAAGVRVGEALATFWEDVDFVEGAIDITHTAVRVKGEGLLRKPRPKTESSMRALPCPPGRWPFWSGSGLRRRRMAGHWLARSSPARSARSGTRTTSCECSGKSGDRTTSCGSRRTTSARRRRPPWTTRASRLG
jgi:hypothetical protein